MLDVTVVVATCGSEIWRAMGDRAAVSVEATGAKVIRFHGQAMTVAQARNAGLSQVRSEYVVFLDADDALDVRYFIGVEPKADVTATMIKYPQSTVAMMPIVWQHENLQWKRHRGYCIGECLLDGNWIHVGAICRTEAVRAVGGFSDKYPVYEDWALFLAMQQNGATFGHSFGSIYNAAVVDHGMHRNGSMPLEERNKVHEIIINDLVLGS